MFAIDESNYSAVLFDCDGTLVDSMPLHFNAWCEALKDHGAKFSLSWEEFLSRAGMGMEQTVHEWNRSYDCSLSPAAVVESQRQHFAANHHKLQEIEAVAIEARRLAKQGFPVAVVSGGSATIVKESLVLTQLASCFRVVVTPEQVALGKPAPDMFLLAAEALGVAPGRCLVIEDGAMGIEAAKAARMDVLVIGPEYWQLPETTPQASKEFV